MTGVGVGSTGGEEGWKVTGVRVTGAGVTSIGESEGSKGTSVRLPDTGGSVVGSGVSTVRRVGDSVGCSEVGISSSSTESPPNLCPRLSRKATSHSKKSTTTPKERCCCSLALLSFWRRFRTLRCDGRSSGRMAPMRFMLSDIFVVNPQDCVISPSRLKTFDLCLSSTEAPPKKSSRCVLDSFVARR